ncbi:MAG: transposase domain-containing protein [Rhodobacteraceae bacterium]|nr:transposase domain-containing protein [Paracoccaceae bacterium]
MRPSLYPGSDQTENGVDPHAWLSATLTAIVQSHQHRQIGDLLPWNFVPVEDHDKTTAA